MGIFDNLNGSSTSTGLSIPNQLPLDNNIFGSGEFGGGALDGILGNLSGDEGGGGGSIFDFLNDKEGNFDLGKVGDIGQLLTGIFGSLGAVKNAKSNEKLVNHKIGFETAGLNNQIKSYNTNLNQKINSFDLNNPGLKGQSGLNGSDKLQSFS